MLSVKNLHVSVQGKEILKGVDLKIRPGELHVLMGPNGSGKSTLVQTVMGHPGYEVISGTMMMGGHDIAALAPEKRARTGIFLAFQYPVTVTGVPLGSLLHTAWNHLNEHNRHSPLAFRKQLAAPMRELGLAGDFLGRATNEGFSGGEKKRAEILQLLALKPKVALIDEADSGLDIDSVRLVGRAIGKLKGDMAIVLVTHYRRILQFIEPDFVHVMVGGRIVKSGGRELVEELEERGYQNFQ
ncbi:Fe-S cluster assembly ATPase SufC [Candidatus Berkelbacteria bacterium]|nr:Fe-S cluster assembly ATPase SufC [Candidatus Berkelbacteria bacterium]